MDSNTLENREIASAARSMVFLSNATSQKRCTPESTILAFLRRDEIERETQALQNKGTSILYTASTLMQAKRAWNTKRNTAVVHKPFKPFKTKMKKLFENGEIGITLGNKHHRMLLEDIMGLSVGTEIIYLIHQSHDFVTGANPTWWSRRIFSVADDAKARCHYVEFQNNLYWAVKATVCNNPKKDDLYAKVYTQDDIAKGCTKRGGWGITIELSTGHKKDLLFSDFLQHPLQLQLWVLNQTTNFESIRWKLRNMSNDTSRAGVVKRLLDEAYGDSTLTQDIIFKYTSIVGEREGETRENVLSTAALSTRKIKNHYSLPSSSPAFVSFRERVNTKCREAIEATYGKFNTITSPLLSFTEVSSFHCHLVVKSYISLSMTNHFCSGRRVSIFSQS